MMMSPRVWVTERSSACAATGAFRHHQTHQGDTCTTGTPLGKRAGCWVGLWSQHTHSADALCMITFDVTTAATRKFCQAQPIHTQAVHALSRSTLASPPDTWTQVQLPGHCHRCSSRWPVANTPAPDQTQHIPCTSSVYGDTTGSSKQSGRVDIDFCMHACMHATFCH